MAPPIFLLLPLLILILILILILLRSLSSLLFLTRSLIRRLNMRTPRRKLRRRHPNGEESRGWRPFFRHKKAGGEGV